MNPTNSQQLYSTAGSDSTVAITLVHQPLPELAADEVLVRVEAAPINPSDLGTMFAGADMATVRSRTADVTCADLSAAAFAGAKARLDEAIPLGNEGAGTVVATGSDAGAAALQGQLVAFRGGSYATFRAIKAALCLPLPSGTEPRAGASCFVNPLTALGMVATMRAEGHKALVHTAAASNLGQMLQKICIADGVDLVNIVRSEQQVKLLRDLGARHVCNSSSSSFAENLEDALAATGATIAFDATGGGQLASDILAAMERAISRGAGFSRYGSTVHKQVYLYGSLQPGPVHLHRSYGMAWGVGGWLLTNFLQQIGEDEALQLRRRVVRELTTTFASHYSDTLTLAEALSPDHITIYTQKSTGQKFLIEPQRES
jgi:NADPH:quinone reductase-like Zn-dependent oxidoreductase